MTENTINANWTTPTDVLIGNGRVRDLIPRLLESDRKTTLIVTDSTMTNTLALKKVLKNFDKAPLAFGVFCLPTLYGDETTLALATYVFNSGGFDSLVGIGRAGAIDLAKLIALFDAPKTIRSGSLPPVYTIPVGSNNGAHISDNAFLADHNGPGQFIFDQRLRPTCVILDPSLLPPDSTALLCATAMNTLSQALADWCSDNFNPAEKAVAEKTIRLVFDNLSNAIQNNGSINARIALMSAAVMAHSKTADKLSVTAAFSQAFQILYGVDAGLVAGVLLPHTLTVQLTQTHSAIEALAKTLNINDGFNGFMKAFFKLRQKAGIPAKLDLLLEGRKLKNKDKILIESYASTYPQRIAKPMTQKAALKILSAALRGKLKREQ